MGNPLPTYYRNHPVRNELRTLLETTPSVMNYAPYVGWVTCYPRITHPNRTNPVRNELRTLRCSSPTVGNLV